MASSDSGDADYDPESCYYSGDGSSGTQQCQTLGEWSSCEQVESGTPSTPPPYWDSDDDDDCGPKPSDLYGKFTWKIEQFSQISKRELRSDPFEIGGYKWYILIYPQGCDTCNHLSLFLCVANHDKLLPGWSHLALFTISVVNKDSKKHKYNDTLHRFCKKEHDWGWKKFMEINKVNEGFIDDDTLTIKAQVQVIREKANRPFRCLDCQYRRELIRVYLTGVEKTCAEFFNERKKKLETLIGDRKSLYAFWLPIDQNRRRHLSRDKMDAVLKLIVKHFFIEKEVLSTLVMDSLYSGLRALESQSKLNKLRAKPSEGASLPAPIISIENDMFVLADDVFLLIERVFEELSHLQLPSKEEKGLPTRAKEGCSGEEFNKDTVLRDEKLLTELGRRTLEIFVFAHIFCRIELAYQEAVSLKRQEELIREEEAEQAEHQKREKRAKKKQARQRQSNRKGKSRGKDEKSAGLAMEKHQPQGCPSKDLILDDFSSQHIQRINGKSDLGRDVSDVSDPGDDSPVALHDPEDNVCSPLSWDADTSEIHPTDEACRDEISDSQVDKKGSSVVDDSSSTCSTDSVPSVVVNGPYKEKSSSKNRRSSSSRGKAKQNKEMRDISTSSSDQLHEDCNAPRREPEGAIPFSKDYTEKFETVMRDISNKEVVDTKFDKVEAVKDRQDKEILVNSRTSAPLSSSLTSTRHSHPVKRPITVAKTEHVSTAERTSNATIQTVKSAVNLSASKSEALKQTLQPAVVTAQRPPPSSRPLSAPVISPTRQTIPHVPGSQPVPSSSQPPSSYLPRTFEPHSYRNAIMGIKHVTGPSTSGFPTRRPLNSSAQYTTSSHVTSSSSSAPSSTTGFTPRPPLNSSTQCTTSSHAPSSSSLSSSLQWADKSQGRVKDTTPADNSLSLSQSQSVMPDDFPHLDIINDLLLDDDHQREALDGYHYDNGFHLAGTNPLTQSYPYDVQDYYYDELSDTPLYGYGDVQPLPLEYPVYDCSSMDAFLHNQWEMNGGGADLSALQYSGAMDVNFNYQFPDYSVSSLGGYNFMYKPAGGI